MLGITMGAGACGGGVGSYLYEGLFTAFGVSGFMSPMAGNGGEGVRRGIGMAASTFISIGVRARFGTGRTAFADAAAARVRTGELDRERPFPPRRRRERRLSRAASSAFLLALNMACSWRWTRCTCGVSTHNWLLRFFMNAY